MVSGLIPRYSPSSSTVTLWCFCLFFAIFIFRKILLQWPRLYLVTACTSYASIMIFFGIYINGIRHHASIARGIRLNNEFGTPDCSYKNPIMLFEEREMWRKNNLIFSCISIYCLVILILKAINLVIDYNFLIPALVVLRLIGFCFFFY